MLQKDYVSDLNFLYDALQAHPMLLVDADKKKAFERFYHEMSIRNQLFTYESFIHAASELTAYFEDGHTNIEIPYTEESRCLPLHCEWDEHQGNAMILTKQYEEVPAGAEVIAVNGMKMEDVIHKMTQRIPHENIYLVKSRMLHYPYQNYHVFSEMNLVWLFGKRDTYDVSFQVKDDILMKKCALGYYSGYPDFAEDSEFISYEVQGDTVTLHLNACICNEEYIAVLHQVARACAEKNINTLVLDLSKNMGGSSAVIDEFIKYTHTDSYRRYEMIDYSSGEPQYISCRSNIVLNQKKSMLFPKSIFCRVSCDTFSSARTFAVTLKDNGIAKMIGTPTGGKPNSYGMPKKWKMPKSEVRFRVSTSCFLRPDHDKGEEIALFPDKKE